MENIGKFIEVARQLGVPDQYNFVTGNENTLKGSFVKVKVYFFQKSWSLWGEELEASPALSPHIEKEHRRWI